MTFDARDCAREILQRQFWFYHNQIFSGGTCVAAPVANNLTA
jgi:DNA-binding IclR family transcriptional regulator